jgi:hypothetical protein
MDENICNMSMFSQWMKTHIQCSCVHKIIIKRKGERLCLVNTE